MLRRLSTLLVCFVLIALFAQTAEAQYTVHISSGLHPNGTVVGNDYYYDSLEALWAHPSAVYIFEGTLVPVNVVLYDDQLIQGNHDNSFYSFGGAWANVRTISLSTDGGQYSITSDPGVLYGFFRSTSQYTHLNISSDLTISAGGGPGTNLTATNIYDGSNITASGVTFTGGGPVLVDYNHGAVNRGGTSYDVHSTVVLQGTVFTNNTDNDISRGAVLYLKDVTSGVNLQDSKFIDNNATGLRVEVNDRSYRGTPSITVNLGATAGERTIFSGNNTATQILNPLYDKNADPDVDGWASQQYVGGQGNALVIGGADFYNNSQPTITLNLSSAAGGVVLMLDNMYGETVAESGGAYVSRITMAGGTLYLGEGTTHQFNGTRLGTLGTGNRSNVWTHSGGTMIMGKDSGIELTTAFDQFVFNGGRIILEGDNHIEAHTIDFTSRPTFEISGAVLNEHKAAGTAVLTLDATTLTQPANGSLIDFDITGVRGNVYGQVLVTNVGTGTFALAAGNQPNTSPHYGRTYRALIEGNDVWTTARISASVTRANNNQDLVLTVILNNDIVTAVPLTGGTTMAWNIAGTANWRYETQNPSGYVQNTDMHYSAFIPNDAVVLSDANGSGLTINIMDSGVYVSQQTGYLSQRTPENPNDLPANYRYRQDHVIEYGLRISGVNNWTLNGGSINDDYNPHRTYHDEQINHVARLTFEGSGRLNMYNSNPNVYHDGTVIGTRGYDRDSLTAGQYFDSADGSVVGRVAAGYVPGTHTVTNVYGPGSLGSGKYAGEIAEVDSDMDGDDDDRYVIQSDGFGLKFIGYGGTVNIQNNAAYNALDTDDHFDQRIRVVQNSDASHRGGTDTRIVDTMTDPNNSNTWTYRDDVSTTGVINMQTGRVDSNGDLIRVTVTASDAYWVNYGNFTGENVDNSDLNSAASNWVNTMASGGVIFVDPHAEFSMTGSFDFAQNRILLRYEDASNVMQATGVNAGTFDGGVIWAGYGATVDMTGASFTDNGRFYERTGTDPEYYTYTPTGDVVRFGGAIFFTGGVNGYTGNDAVLTLSAGPDGRTQVARNIAMEGGAIYVEDGSNTVINVEEVDFIYNAATRGSGGAIHVTKPAGGALTTINANRAGFDNNIAAIDGGAIWVSENNIINIEDAIFTYNGVTVQRDAAGAPVLDANGNRTVTAIVTQFGGAIYAERNTHIRANADTTTPLTEFSYNAVQGSGGAVFSLGDVGTDEHNTFTFTGAKFTNNQASGTLANSGSGGAIYAEYTQLTADGATFENNTARDDGGAVWVLGGSAILSADVFDFDGATFTGNRSTNGSGGAVYTAGMRLTGVDSVFENNRAFEDGGAIYIFSLEGTGTDQTINFGTDSTNSAQTIFRGNRAEGGNGTDGSGGAIYVAPNNYTLILDQAQFDSNTTGTANARGGAVYAGGTGVTIRGTSTVFLNNMRGGTTGTGQGMQGGAIYLGSNGEINLSGDFWFSGNEVTSAGTGNLGGQGGAIYAGTGSNLFLAGSLTGGRFDQNIAVTEGGAIFVDNGDDNGEQLLITSTQFYSNKSRTRSGGAIYAKNMIVGGYETTFYGNEAGTDGGALHLEVSDLRPDNHAARTVELEDSTFELNIAQGLSGGRGVGGAIFLDFHHATLNADGSVFLSNEASGHGGAIFSEKVHAVLNLNGAVFSASSTSPGVGNVSLTGSGGAIYLKGDETDPITGGTTPTSWLYAAGATFSYNSADGDGGAVYAYYADVDITGAIFTYNTSVSGNGGGLYYHNENDKELVIESTTFGYNTAASGGAIYTVNETLIQARDMALSYNKATVDDGGAIYFAAAGSQLNISRTDTTDDSILISYNTAFGNGGAIRMQSDSLLIANGAYFLRNEAGIYVDDNNTVYYGAGNGGAISIDGKVETGAIATIQAANATFERNTAHGGSGGAIHLDDISTINPYEGLTLNSVNLDGGLLRYNTAGLCGGAIYATRTDLNVASATIENNVAAGNGGALCLTDSDLNALGATLRSNSAGGVGGAVYFKTTTANSRSIYLGAATNSRASITGNTMHTGANNQTPNSIYFETTNNVLVHIDLEVATDAGGVLSQRDPMAVSTQENSIDLDIVKTGAGTWELGGYNDFRHTEVGTTVGIDAGTFALLPAAQLLLTNLDGNDHFVLHDGANFIAGSASDTTGPARLETTNLTFEAGTTMKLDTGLELNIGTNYTISSVLSGTGSLVKMDNNLLTFDGATDSYNGDVSILQGGFRINSNPLVPGSGRFETKYGTFSLAEGTSLYLTANSAHPSLTARTVTIGDDVSLGITGISGTYDDIVILIHTTHGINGEFANVDADGKMRSTVDYLTFDLGYLNWDESLELFKDYGGTIGFRWYSTPTEIPAWGRFTLEEETDYFNVDVVLTNQSGSTNRYTGLPTQPGHDPNWLEAWDGNKLDKLGLGTLELSCANTYEGETRVRAGELYLTNSQGTGIGDFAVTVYDHARLGLNFTGQYDKTVTGGGGIYVRGGVVELTAENTHTGGTYLVGGVLEFTTAGNLGDGTVTFEGGTLRNKAVATIDQSIVIAGTKSAYFDVPLYDAVSSTPSLTVDGVISGLGNLEKTGAGIMALTAANTFTGTSYVREGALKLDGSVGGDVRVSKYASIGGTGTVGDSLYIATGGYYDWYFSPDRSASEPLNVDGSVFLADGAIFRPRTDSTELDFNESIVGWTVLTYGGSLAGTFAQIDDTFNAYYSFELDYSVDGEVRVAGELLTQPKALGDIVATSLALANKKLYRQPFAQLMRETTYRKAATRGQEDTVRGQQDFQPTRSIWFTPMARANKFGTNFVGGNYDFESYGMQAGSTLWSNFNSSLGLMFGYERGNLRNTLDQIRSHDYYLGLYYGHIFNDGYEIRAFLGGGFQKYTMFRNDTSKNYKATYDGSSYAMNVEFGKLFAGRNGTLLRPYIAADIEHGSISSAQENQVGNAYRNYDKADLSQMFVRFGLDLEKRGQYVDLNGGISYSGLLFGKRRAEASIFYPVRGAGTSSYSARLGRSSLMLKTGLNWNLNRLRTNSIFLDYFADIYMDRAADTVQHTANVGVQVRF